ncbi:DUF4225 domain-containing protein [Photobacterium kagoshimensis]|uniref:DUF4225 domain-containing protein n=1 Tax=Photobacterium kagoshimensis TaxID=2910242 RepID=UPI003D0ABBC8
MEHIEVSLLTKFLALLAYVKSDFEQGRKTELQAIKEIDEEKNNLFEQGVQIAIRGVGVIAGAMQIGAGVCYKSAGVLCASVGAPLLAHGVNNVYENSVGGDEEGIVRKGYRRASKLLGYGNREADITYGVVDLGLSGYGLINTLKVVPNASVSNVKKFKLFRYSSYDYIKGYRTMSKPALMTEISADTVTVKNLYEKK